MIHVNPSDRELKTSEVAALLGFSETAILLWVRQGHLKVRVTPGGHRRYRLKDVNDFGKKLAEGAYKATAPKPLPPEKKLSKFLKKKGIKPGR